MSLCHYICLAVNRSATRPAGDRHARTHHRRLAPHPRQPISRGPRPRARLGAHRAHDDASDPGRRPPRAGPRRSVAERPRRTPGRAAGQRLLPRAPPPELRSDRACPDCSAPRRHRALLRPRGEPHAPATDPRGLASNGLAVATRCDTGRMPRPSPDGGGGEPSTTLRSQHVEATRRAVLAAARSSFGGKGYAQTSVDEIAAAARVTKGAVYHHFAGKEALFRAVHAEVEARGAGAGGRRRETRNGRRSTRSWRWSTATSTPRSTRRSGGSR